MDGRMGGGETLEQQQAWEKVLNKLESIDQKMESMDQRIAGLEAGQKALEAGQKALDERIEVSRRETRELFESTNKNIQAIAEQHIEIMERFNSLVDYPITKGRLATVEQVVKDHTREIRKLKEQAV